jgi:2,3-bisphosphoglycerate-independent phosphoglycerate mutase
MRACILPFCLQVKDNDQYLPSFVITDADGKACGTVEDGDAVVLFNFRSDRMVELSKAFEYTEDDKFKAFDRERVPKVRSRGQPIGVPKAAFAIM